MTVQTQPYDTADYLDTPERIEAYLDAMLEDGDAAEIRAALGTIARARGLTQVAEATGLGRDGLDEALFTGGTPRFETIVQVVKALGLRLSLKPVGSGATP